MSEHIKALEKATQLTTAGYLLGALRHSGTDCLLYKKKKSFASDEVYGIYGGNELTTALSDNIYDQPLNTSNLTDEEIIELEFPSEKPRKSIIIDDSFEDPVRLRVLLNHWEFRSADESNAGWFDDPRYAFIKQDELLEVDYGDVIEVIESDSVIRVKIISKQVIGNREKAVVRLQISNIGD